ncbi:MAG: hypothetical protein ACR2N0_09720 [Rubrobacteraceae bacterium]|nr:hypothetical protein [Rubrobacter sp.]
MESLDKLESLGGEIWISANSGEGNEVNIVFPKHVWDDLLSKASDSDEPTEAELGEWNSLFHRLLSFAKEHSFETILEDVPCGDSGGLSYDLVLRSNELYAVTSGYFFAPTIEAGTAGKLRAALERDSFVEQAYAIGAVADEGAFTFGNDDLKIVSARGRKSSASRFEMAPELWRTLSEKLGWTNVETIIPNDKG